VSLKPKRQEEEEEDERFLERSEALIKGLTHKCMANPGYSIFERQEPQTVWSWSQPFGQISPENLWGLPHSGTGAQNFQPPIRKREQR
jgi:hypothetical protein